MSNRPNHPAKSDIYVKLVCENELRKDTVKKFYSTVKANVPEGILSHYEVSGPDNMPAQSMLVHRITEDGQHEYEIPLYRNLTPDEIYEVTLHLNKNLTEGDFLFETSTFDEDCCLEEDFEEDEFMDPETFEIIAEKLSERVHNNWLHERVNAGWRYGPKRDDKDKTHPLIKPWHQLSEEEKAIDYTLPEFFIDLLQEHGYTVISNSELDKLIESISKDD